MNSTLAELPPGLLDRRATAAQAHGPAGAWKVFDRPWSKVTGFCLHQTACVLGERPERWDSVGTHFGVTRSGQIVWLHDLTHVVAAANGWNAQCVSIEVDGLFAGVEGDPATLWHDPAAKINEVEMRPLTAQLEAVKAIVRWGAREIMLQGGQLHALVAHRQSSADRRDDPGSAVWQGAGLPLIAELGLDDGGPGFKLDNGYPIPGEWDPRRVGIRY